MRSVYAKILLWCFGMLVIALIGFGIVSMAISMRGGGLGGHMERMILAAFEQSRNAYETGGAPALRETLEQLQKVFQIDFELIDSKNKDLLTGQDRTDAVRASQSRGGFPSPYQGRMVFEHVHGQYRFLSYFVSRVEFLPYLPYYLVILAAIAALCWALALNIASPLRRLTLALDRFGAGDLSARVTSKRKDEIGKLSNSFDRMADRIETLLTAERRLLQDISHELRSPLSRLSFAAELVRSAKDPEAAAARVKKEVQRLASLVGALVEMTRAEGDPAAREFRPVHLELLLTEVVEDCRVDAASRGCTIELEVDSDVVPLGDGELLRRALENIVRNSVHYSLEHTRVEVRLKRTPNSVLASVRDHGRGVPESDLVKIFQPFYRVDDSREAATGGVGLGLSIAARAIALHHGSLWAENSHPGLTVWIELPLAPDAVVSRAGRT